MALHEVISGGDFDLNVLGDALAKPGMDPRGWVSIGLVEAATTDSQDQQTVEFDPELGPLVQVTLQPSGTPVACRVAGPVGGYLQAEYNPFVDGDEVIVLVPGGDERAGCVIIGRLNNGVDLWPGAVAGQDATTNTFGYRRQQEPFIFEFATSYLMRNSTSGSLMNFVNDGSIVMNDANANSLSMTADEVRLQSGDGNEMILFNLTAGNSYLYLQGGSTTGATFNIGDQSSFFSAGTLNLNLFGNPAIEHALSTEAALNMLNQFIPLLGAALGTAFATIPAAPTFPGGNVFSQALIALTGNTEAVAAIITAMLGTAATAPLATNIIAAINEALVAKPGDPSGTFPCVGSPGIFIG